VETRASYFLVGLFVLALMAGTFVFVLWLARAGLQAENVYYYIYVRGSVAGLQNGAPVQYRGVPVGTVTDISIDAENVELIQITVALRTGTPVKTDTVATLQLQGITGLSFVQLSGGTRAAADLEPPPGKRRARIPYRPSAIERVFEDAPEVVGQLITLSGRANQLLSDDNIRALSSIVTNLDRLTTAVAGSGTDVERAVTQAADMIEATRATAANLNELAVDLRQLSAEIGGEARLALGDARKATRTAEETAQAITSTANAIQRLASEVHGLASETRRPLRDFGEHGLYEMSQMLIDARALVTSLNRIAIQFERDPARFLFGDQQKGIEAR
jgi:phospholipid/cholesterol/gamma-HCH transport system substrate-binding protein